MKSRRALYFGGLSALLSQRASEERNTLIRR
jgi:hypothetical protein